MDKRKKMSREKNRSQKKEYYTKNFLIAGVKKYCTKKAKLKVKNKYVFNVLRKK